MRSAKEQDYFPYNMNTMCYFEVDKSGNTNQIKHKNKGDRDKVFEAYMRAVGKTTTLYAVWAGNWSSDLFIIDDLDAFAKALNF